MSKFDIRYGEILGSSLKAYARDRPSIPAAKRRYEEIEIPGRNGVLHEDMGTYEQCEFTIPFNYYTTEQRWHDRWREIQKWLSKANAELSFNDDPEYFYRIDHVTLEDIERTSRRIGNFEATFISPDGLQYLQTGKKEHDIKEVKNNRYEPAYPIYKIQGTGICDLIVNGSTMRMNIEGDIIIDTERMIAYRKDGKMQNTSVTGDYDELILMTGDNTITVTSGFTAKVIPNWRRL